MLHLGREQQVTGTEVRSTPAVGDQVEGLRRVADEDDLAMARRSDEGGDRHARGLVAGVGIGAELVQPAMDVRVVVGVRVGHGVDDVARLLR